MRASIGAGFAAAIVLVASALQLWLAWPDEIIARANPYDQIRYLEMAESIAAGDWLGPFDVMALTRDVSYSVWIAVVHATGVPLRVANELLLLGASLSLCLALIRSGYPAVVGGCALGLLVLQPHGMLALRDLLPSSFYAATLILSLAGLLLSVTSRRSAWRWGHLVWSSIALGILWTTRPEQPLIVVLVVAFVACDFALAKVRADPIRTALARSTATAAILTAGIGSIVATVAALNFQHYGVWRTSDYQAPGFAAANRVLLSIVQTDPLRLVPVPYEVRQRAYAVSPAFAALRPVLEGPSWARGVSCNMDDVCDDIAGGYFRWILREAVASRVDSHDASSLDAGFLQVARELDEACRDGTLECRRSLSSFLHPYPETYLPHIVDSIGRVFGRMASTGGVRDRVLARDPPNFDPRLQQKFDRVANRRVELARLPRDRITVRASAPTDEIVAARLDIASRKSELALEAAPHASRAGFRIRFEVEQPDRRPMSRYPVLEFDRASGSVTRMPIPLAGETSAGAGITLETERWEKPPPPSTARPRVRGALWNVHAGLIRLATLAGGLSLVGLFASGRRGSRWAPGCVAIALIGIAVASRMALLTMVDASSFPAFSTRYVYPMVSLFSVTMLLVTHRAWRVYRSR